MIVDIIIYLKYNINFLLLCIFPSYAYVDEVHPSVCNKLQEMQSAFGVENIAILSNSVGSCDDENFADAIVTEQRMKMSVIRHMKKKPGCLNEVLNHFQGVMIMLLDNLLVI